MTFDADESLKTISKFLALNCLLAKYECRLCNDKKDEALKQQDHQIDGYPVYNENSKRNGIPT